MSHKNTKITIVSVTPAAIERDSRTFKEAASFSRAGFRSIVVEGETSSIKAKNLPFELISPGNYHKTEKIRNQNKSRKKEQEIDCQKNDTSSEIKFIDKVKKHKYLINRSKRFLRSRVLIYFARYLLRFYFSKGSKWYAFYLEELIPKADLYILHAPYYFPAIRRLSKKYSVSYFYDAHDFYTGIKDEGELNAKERLMNKFHLYLERRCIRYAEEVLTVSKGIADLIKNRFQCTPVVIHNYQDSRINQSNKSDIRTYLSLDRKVLLLVIVGNAKQGQALQEFINALSSLPQFIHCAFVGGGYETLLNPIIMADLQKRIHIIPSVKSFEVVPFIQSADASVILYYERSNNYKYCLPNGFFQSISAGLPILYPGLIEIEKIGMKYDLGVKIDPENSNSIIKGIRFLLDEDKINAIRKNVENARKSFEWSIEEKKLLNLIKTNFS